jgi:hypothetical protein
MPTMAIAGSPLAFKQPGTSWRCGVCDSSAGFVASTPPATTLLGGLRSFFLRLRGLMMRGRLFSELFEPELSSLAMLSESMFAMLEEPAFSFPTSGFGLFAIVAVVVVVGVAVVGVAVFGSIIIIGGGFFEIISVDFCTAMRDAVQHRVTDGFPLLAM